MSPRPSRHRRQNNFSLAHEWLCAMGEPERIHVLSRLWPDFSNEEQMVRMALAVGDREPAESAVADANRRAEISAGVPSLALENGDAAWRVLRVVWWWRSRTSGLADGDALDVDGDGGKDWSAMPSWSCRI
jgi:hypothetical protein